MDLSDTRYSTLRGHKVLFVFLGSELGGAERQGLLLARHLKDHCGADVHVLGLAADQPGRVSELCNEYGIPWIPIPLKWWSRRLRWLLEITRFAGQVRKMKPDIILSYTWLPNLVCGLVWNLTGARTFVWNQRDEGMGLNTSFWHRAAARLTPCFVANSVAGKDFLVNTYGSTKERVRVIHNGVVLERPALNRREWREKLGIEKSDFVACMVANLHQNKDHATLLIAWKKLLNQAPPGARSPVLLLAGRFDGTEATLKGLAADLDLGENCRFLGKVLDIPGLLQAADLCVHSSKSEGLPNAILEAMAAGLPVVATDIPGNREAVGTLGQPYLVPQEDPEALAATLQELMNNPEAARRLGLNLKERAGKVFSPQNLFEQMVALLPALSQDDLK